MKIGYARVSTLEQNLTSQIQALEKAGCEKVFEDKISGVKWNRPGFDRLLDQLRPGDNLVVWRLDRLGRSLKELIEIVGSLQNKGVGLISITETIDTSTPTGQLVFHVFGALAEFERNLIVERTRAGLEAARASGKLGGRPSKLSKIQVDQLRKLYEEKRHTIKEICEILGISKATLYRYLTY